MIKKLKSWYQQNSKDRYNDISPFAYTMVCLLDVVSYWRYLYKNRKNLYLFKETKKLQNSMRGKNAFVFANGPSLNLLDWEKVRRYQKEEGYKVFVVNSFINMFEDEIIPDYYILSDPAHFGFDFEGSTPEIIAELNHTLELIEKYKIPLFIPIEFKDRIDLKTEIYYFNDAELRVFNNNITNITKCRSYSSNTAHKSLAISCYLGFDNVCILGYDRDYFKSYFVDIDNNLYDINKHTIDLGNDGKYPLSGGIGYRLRAQGYIFSKFHKYPKNIINLNPEGLIDAFDKYHSLDIYKNN